VAFSDIGKRGIDKSDLSKWATSKEAQVFIDEISTLKKKAFVQLLKCNACDHDKYVESYKAYESILRLMSEASLK
jgi:hypothetical protein